MKKNKWKMRIASVLICGVSLTTTLATVSCSVKEQQIEIDTDTPIGDSRIVTFTPGDTGATLTGTTMVKVKPYKPFYTVSSRPTVSKPGMKFVAWKLHGETDPIPESYKITTDIILEPILEPEIVYDDGIFAEIDEEFVELDKASLYEDSEYVWNVDKTQSWPKTGDDGFNYPILIEAGVTIIFDGFLAGCTKFNSPITFDEHAKLTYIGDSFLADNTVFNQELVLPNNLAIIGNDFLFGCTAFNNGSDGLVSKPLNLPANIYKISDRFMHTNTAFNQDIIFSQNSILKTIGNGFLHGCSNFDKILTIPSSVTEIGNYFTYNCNKFTTIKTDIDVYSFNVSKYSFANENRTSAQVLTGMKVLALNSTDRTKEFYDVFGDVTDDVFRHWNWTV